jgi:pyruvate,water dikinase
VGEVLWLDEVADLDRDRVGEKAFTLARLRRLGLPVPDGFVLLARDATLDAARADALRAAYARLGGTVAVRSSSTLEDTGGASFAGQYRTVLGVCGEDEVVRAAGACLDSAAAAAGYARAVGAAGAGAMAVLVQRLVEARAAGVAFTAHPQDPSSWLVESHAGRGEAVVSGSVTPDRYRGARDSDTASQGPPDGVLDAHELAAVVGLARRAEQLLGGPQDVEWALDGDRVALLQSRPITTPASDLEVRDPRVRRLTRANVGEVLPDAVTPLTWTTVVAFLEHGFQAVTRSVGVRPRDCPPFLVRHRQRVYLNLTLSAEIAARLPGIRAEDAERLVLGEGGAGARRRTRAATLPGLAVAWSALGLARRLPAEVEAGAELVRRLPTAREIEAASDEALARMLEAFVEIGRPVATAHIATSSASAARLALLGRLVPVSDAPASARVNRLVAGLDGLESAEPATALEALAAEAARRPEWLAWCQRPPDEAAARLRQGDVPSDLEERLQAFLARFGHRAVSEGELREPAWEDDPRPVLLALQTMLDATVSPGFGRRAGSEVRRAEEEALMGRLGMARRALVRYALAGARRGISDRERTKSLAITLVHHGRRLVRAAARRLAGAGAIASPDDVYFLTLAELVTALGGGPLPHAALERRRRAFVREGAGAVPRDVDLDAPAVEGGPAATSGSTEVLTGIGVSAGVGTGVARVLHGMEGARLEPGEVLVAAVLDAAYAPLLAVAAGALAEVGGLLSHGSVVARELGVPCVVDVTGATEIIATGDRVAVDGDAGRVTRLPREGAAGGEERGAAVLEHDLRDEAGPHVLEDHPLARESVYFNVQDPASGLVVVASLGRRAGEAGEALLAVGLPGGRVLFGLDRGAAATAGGLAVGGATASWRPVGLRVSTRLSTHEAVGFPPAPVPLLLGPRTVDVSLDLSLLPTTPAVDLCAGLPDDVLASLRPLGAHHVEQSGAWRGTVVVDGHAFPFSGTGSRDHSWGLRDWEAPDYWRLFTGRLGDDLAVHALSVSVRGRLVEGGFVWRAGRAERVTRVRCAALRQDGALRSFELEVSTASGHPLRLAGTVWRALTVPVQLDRRPWRHLAGRPYRLLLQENFTRFEGEGRTGHGMAEITLRPS